jgi:hypothetical protein
MGDLPAMAGIGPPGWKCGLKMAVLPISKAGLKWPKGMPFPEAPPSGRRRAMRIPGGATVKPPARSK